MAAAIVGCDHDHGEDDTGAEDSGDSGDDQGDENTDPCLDPSTCDLEPAELVQFQILPSDVAMTPAARRDLRSLRSAVVRLAEKIADETEDGFCEPLVVEVEYLGVGEAADEADFEVFPSFFEEDDCDDAVDMNEMVAFNPGTQNQFRIRFPEELLRLSTTYGERRGLQHGSADRDPAVGEPRIPGVVDGDAPTVLHDPSNPTASTRTDHPEAGDLEKSDEVDPLGWSNNFDNRRRLGALNTGITNNPWRKIADMGSCTTALVGPRHGVTAAHCLYNRRNQTWAVNLVVTPGRNGSDGEFGTTIMTTSPPPGTEVWYFVPDPWLQPNPGGQAVQYDFGIIVTPDRIGERVSTNGIRLGWFGYWYAKGNSLRKVDKYNRGYPVCNGFASWVGEARIDDPADPSAPPNTGTNLARCDSNHLYGDENICSIGGFSNKNKGWNRNFKHSCDASAGQSGSPIYFYGDGNVGNPGGVYVTGMDVASLCGGWPSQKPCRASTRRQDRAFRLTPEASDLIMVFRNMFE